MSTTRRSTSSHNGGANRQRGGGAERQEIEVLNRQRLREIDRNRAAELSRDLLDRIGLPDAFLTITFIRDRAMRRLNRDYRGIDRTTDVLSFAYHESGGVADDDETRHIGDVVISVETAERYAREQGLSFDREIEHLVIHGALHLAGYDHETDNGEMKKLERKLRKELLNKPWNLK
ncbi:MAG TPA: rRNA maturation RNase YbeY [Blastocatellia bacterium]|nr:rRNA maturation RNase YbeY [Blastocatellia bacterium]